MTTTPTEEETVADQPAAVDTGGEEKPPENMPVDMPPCPKCEKADGVKAVPETDPPIYHHDACGMTWGGEESAEEVAEPEVAGAVEPKAPDPEPANLPAVPEWTEWQAIRTMAETFSKANIAPRGVRGKPNDMALLLWTGRDLGISLTAAMREVYVIDGQPSISPRLRLARVKLLKLGKIIPDPLETQDETTSTALAVLNVACMVCTGASGWVVREAEPPMACPACHTTGWKMAGPPISFTMKDATAAKLAGKDNWQHYPKNMLWWRASGYAADTYFPEAGLGLYSPDELGAVTDEYGEPVFIDAQAWSDGQNELTETTGQDAELREEARELHAKVASLSAPHRQEVIQAWKRAKVPAVELTAMSKGDFRKARAAYVAWERQHPNEAEAATQAAAERAATASHETIEARDEADEAEAKAMLSEAPGGPEDVLADVREAFNEQAEFSETTDVYNKAEADVAVKAVEEMTIRQVNSELKVRDLRTDDEEKDRRLRLVRAIATEAAVMRIRAKKAAEKGAQSNDDET